MAEVVAVVGIIASVIGIIDGIDKSRTIWKKYIHSSASLRAELLPILGKLTAFAGILRGLQLQCELDELDDGRLKLLAQIEQPLKASEQAVRLISARLDQVASLGRVSLSFGKVLNKETTAALHILDQARPVLDLALAADQRTLVKSIDAYVRNVAKDLCDARLEVRFHYEDLKEELHDIKAKEAKSNQSKAKAEVLAWISHTNYTSNYHAAREPTQHVDTSGDWFIAGNHFQDWATGGSCSRLLLTGISGSGKTVLCAKSIEYLAQTKPISGTSPTILYFFFDFNDAAKESVEGMIRALLCQLLSSKDNIPDDVQTFYTKYQGITSARPLVRTWIDLLSTHLHNAQDVFIFIDALDECTEAEAALLRASLKQLIAAAGNKVRWLLTCRPSENAATDLHGVGFATVFMETATVDKDIQAYLTTSLRVDPRLSSFSKAAGDSIIVEITVNSSGMFRYAHCQLETLAKLRDRRLKKVQEVLRTMPKTISESYSRILLDAERLDDWPIVERILLLVSFSTRPVTIAEVSEFAILEDDMTSLDAEDRFDLSEAFATISPMITVRDGYITLAHKSVHDFFAGASEPWSLFYLCQNANTAIAKKCLQYLRFSQEPVAKVASMKTVKEPNTTQLNNLLKNYPFLDYAATRWAHHLPEKRLQEEVVESMARTLPLNSKPNLWKAWLLLQRADIWENQIQLASILCESFVRGALVTSWSQNFWQERQNYRIRSDALAVSKRLLRVDDAVAKRKLVDKSLHMEEQSYFWSKALNTHREPGPPGLIHFEKGDLILIKEKGPGPSWIGCINGEVGLLSPGDVEPCQSNANPRLSGGLFHELAILLLEIAFQTPLCAEAMTLWSATSSLNELALYIAQLRDLTSQAVRKMGLQYGKIIDECLSKIQWLDQRTQAKAVDVLDAQESCMEKVCKPLGAILSSRFQAARNPVKRPSKFQFNPYATGTPDYSGSASSAASAPYQTSASVGYTSYGAYQLGSMPPSAYGRAMSTEPTRAAFVSQSGTYRSSPSPVRVYQTSSASATAATYSSSVSAPMHHAPNSAPSRPSTISVTGSLPPLPPVAATAPTARAGSTFQGSPLTSMETVLESESVALKITSIGSVPYTVMDSIVESKEERVTLRTSDIPSEPKAAMDTIHELEKNTGIDTTDLATRDAQNALVESEPRAENTAEGDLRTIPDFKGTSAAGKASEAQNRGGNATTAGGHSKALRAHDVDATHLSWDFTDGLSYSAFTNEQNRPTYFRVSDDEMNVTLEGAREGVLRSEDAEAQLLWARHALCQVHVAEINRLRTFSQAYRPVNVPYPDDDLHRDALSLVRFLAEQGRLDALYLQAKYEKRQEVDHESENTSLTQLKMIADNGHAAACYGVALALEAAGRDQESIEYYEKGAARNSAGALYAIGAKAIKEGDVPAIRRGLELLFKSAEVADADTPEVLFDLGLIYAHESTLLSGNRNPVPLNNKHAVNYLQRAAFYGSAEAQLRLGTAYEKAELDLELSLSKALHYYILAARRGQSEAEMNISMMMLCVLDSGDGQSENIARAAYLYARRATLGDLPNALFAVGYYHELGIGVVADRVHALEWYREAAQRGSPDAKGAISRLRGPPPSLPKRPPPQPSDDMPVRHDTMPAPPPRLPPRPAQVAQAVEKHEKGAYAGVAHTATHKVKPAPAPRPMPPIPNRIATDTGTANMAPTVAMARPPMPPVRRAEVDLAARGIQTMANEMPYEPGTYLSMAARMKNMLGRKKDEVVGTIDKKVSVRASVGNLGLLSGRQGK